MKRVIIAAALIINSLIAVSQKELLQTVLVVGDEDSTWEAWFLSVSEGDPIWVLVPELSIQDTQGGSEIYAVGGFKYVHKKISDPSFRQEVYVYCSKQMDDALFVIPECDITIIKDHEVIYGCPNTVVGIQKM
jgi:hypothetical protein